MRCPKCNHEITDAEARKQFAAKGGKTSRRQITPEQQSKMQDARKTKKTEKQ